MRAVTWVAPRVVEVQERPDPVILSATDAIIRVTAAGICGTDLHPYRGELPSFPRGTVLGHEVVGVVTDVGDDVRSVRPGDRVWVSDVIACGSCLMCARGLHYQCAEVTLLGYGDVVGRPLDGGQAEFLRVPNADVVTGIVPAGMSDVDAVFIGDVLSTAYCGVEATGLRAELGDVLGVVGAGPVGLLAVLVARSMGLRVVAVDPDVRRVDEAIGAGALAVTSVSEAAPVLVDLGARSGTDAVLEAVGTAAALESALAMVRPAGTVVAVGAHKDEAVPFSTRDAFARELVLRFVVGDPIRVGSHVTELIRRAAVTPSIVVTHQLPLTEAATAYELFDRRIATKVILLPDEPSR